MLLVLFGCNIGFGDYFMLLDNNIGFGKIILRNLEKEKYYRKRNLFALMLVIFSCSFIFYYD